MLRSSKKMREAILLILILALLTGCAGGSDWEETGTGSTAGKEETSSTELTGEDTSSPEESPSADEVGGTVAEETTKEETEAPRQYIVCLDAGHGGLHGATSPLDGRHESDDTLSLALAVQRELSVYEDVTIIMTRTEDVHVENKARPQMANDAGADLFVSIHRNSNTSGDKGGIEGWIHCDDPPESREVGEMILNAMEAVGVTANYGIKTGSWDEPDVNYTVIEYAQMPAVLLEVGYLNYAKDNDLFDKNLDAYAEAIADAIYRWLTR